MAAQTGWRDLKARVDNPALLQHALDAACRRDVAIMAVAQALRAAGT
jgi:hypothetical protein